MPAVSGAEPAARTVAWKGTGKVKRIVDAMLAAGLALAAPGAVSATGCDRDAEAIYSETERSVVQIFSVAVNPFLLRDRVMPRAGTGFVIGDNLIVTNFHVIAEARELAIATETQSAGVYIVGADPALDIAVLAPAEPISLGPPLEFAAAGAAAIGQPVFAIGHPLGIGKSITQGIVSGLSRDLRRTTTSWLSPYLQTDAAISPGNSGGPLLGACGTVLGMISAGISDAGAENLGFAIPVGVLVPALEQIVETGRVRRPWHGLFGRMTSPPILMMLGIPETDWEDAAGFLVETVEPGSAADLAGLSGGSWPVLWGGEEFLLGGDIITEVDGQRIRTLDDAIAAVGALEIGQEVTIAFNRWGMRLVVDVSIPERPILQQEIDLYQRFQPPG